MNCIVTAGPTFEPLDEARRLTNFSTGRLGSELTNFLFDKGHAVTLLIGQQAIPQLRSARAEVRDGERRAHQVETFTTTADLCERLRAMAGQPVDAVFHAAAVCDFTFGKVWARSADGQLTEIQAGKISTSHGSLLAELIPTPKIIASLRDWFPTARLVGWKYEVDGDRAGVIQLARRQIAECRTDACVANGPAYGDGFGLVSADGPAVHVADAPALFELLEKFIRR